MCSRAAQRGGAAPTKWKGSRWGNSNLVGHPFYGVVSPRRHNEPSLPNHKGGGSLTHLYLVSSFLEEKKVLSHGPHQEVLTEGCASEVGLVVLVRGGRCPPFCRLSPLMCAGCDQPQPLAQGKTVFSPLSPCFVPTMATLLATGQRATA